MGAAWAVVAVVAAAHEPEPVSIQWSAPDACPTADAVRRRVADYVAAQTDEPGGADIEAQASIEPADGGWRLSLKIRSTSGTSTSAAADPDCRVLADLAAIKIAMAVTAQAQERAAEAPAPPDRPPPDRPPPRSPQARPKPPPETKQSRRWVALQVGSGIDWYSLPGYGFGYSAGLALVGVPLLRVDAEASFWPARRFFVVDDPSIGGEVRMVVGHAAACPVPRVRTVEFPLCVGIELGAVHGRGFGFDAARTQRALRAAITVLPGVIWVPHDHLAFRVRGGVLVPVTRYAFQLSGIDAVYRNRAVGFRVAVGFEVRL